MKGRRIHAGRAALALLAVIAWLAGCGRGPGDRAARSGTSRPRALAVRVFSDTGRTEALAIGRAPYPARVWLARVSRSPGVGAMPLPEAAPDTLPPEPRPASLIVDDALKPPIQRGTSDLTLPPGIRGGARFVELDVRVDPFGRVGDVRWAGGDADSALVRAATRCAEAMTFYPALLRGEPVEVWCRQRFEFGP
jgi:hypothetical protein